MVTRNQKFLPENGEIPKQGKYACRTCKEWFASTCGKAGHFKKHPDHAIYSLLTGKKIPPPAKREKKQWVSLGHISDTPTNGHRAVTTVLLQSAFAKLREEVTAELDRLEAQLFPATQPLKPATLSADRQAGSRRTYVAR